MEHTVLNANAFLVPEGLISCGAHRTDATPIDCFDFISESLENLLMRETGELESDADYRGGISPVMPSSSSILREIGAGALMQWQRQRRRAHRFPISTVVILVWPLRPWLPSHPLPSFVVYQLAGLLDPEMGLTESEWFQWRRGYLRAGPARLWSFVAWLWCCGGVEWRTD